MAMRAGVPQSPVHTLSLMKRAAIVGRAAAYAQEVVAPLPAWPQSERPALVVPIATAFFIHVVHAVNPVGAAGGASGCLADALAAELVTAVDRAPIIGKEVPVAERGSAATHAARHADQRIAPSVGAEGPKAAKGRAPPGVRVRAAGAAQLHGGMPLLAHGWSSSRAWTTGGRVPKVASKIG